MSFAADERRSDGRQPDPKVPCPARTGGPREIAGCGFATARLRPGQPRPMNAEVAVSD